jgi:hypothetical protein
MMGLGEEMIERREHPRIAVSRRIDVVVNEWAQLPVRDVSMGGLRLMMPVAPKIGVSFVVHITLPNALLLSLEAEVRYVGPADADGRHAVGLRWLNPDESELLTDLVAAAQ